MKGKRHLVENFSRERRLFVSEDLFSSACITPHVSQAHYLRNVLRLRSSDSVRLFNGRDGEWRASIRTLDRNACTLEVGEQIRKQTVSGDIWYIFAPIKGERLAYLVQKVTEMGASRVCPILTERTNVQHFNVERAEMNVIEAAQQCNLLSIPMVEKMDKMGAYLDRWPEGRSLIVCDEHAPVHDPVASLQKVRSGPLAVLVGPEGGFSPEERASLHRYPFVLPLSLGPRTVRADTAAVVVLSLVQAVLGDFKKTGD